MSVRSISSASGLFHRARLAALAGAATTLLIAASPASAQFVCSTSSTDSTCTNSGTDNAGNANITAVTNQNATSTNSGTVNGDVLADTSGGGNAVGINSGTVNGALSAFADFAGNATAINSGTVNGSLQATTGGGGNASATNSGKITGDFTAVTFSGGNATASNSGTLVGNLIAETLGGGDAIAINSGTAHTINVLASSGNAMGTNSGTITHSLGVGANIGNATAINSGTIGGFLASSTSGVGDATAINSGAVGNGVFAQTGVGGRGNAAVINSGAVSGDVEAGTVAGGNATAINSGTLSGTLGASVNSSGDATAINSGTANNISAFSFFGNATVINSGSVSGEVELFAGGTSTLVNSGRISNFGGTAISFDNGPDTLTLLSGSVIVGGIQLAGTNDTVNVRAGNQNLTFASLLTGVSITGNVPFAVSGSRIASVDPTPFALADKNLMDFTGAVSSILGSLGDTTSVSSAPSKLGFAPESGANRIGDAFAGLSAYAESSADRMLFKNPTMVYDDGRSVWARGFAGERFQQADGADLRAHNLFEGGAIGADLVVRPELRLGIFAGGGHSDLSIDLNGSSKTDTVFGGIYGRYLFSSFGHASFIDFALHGGGSNINTSRSINNNLLATGLETATASYSGSYISPELTYGIKLPVWADTTLTPSLKLRYVAGSLGGYTESGSTANLTVASRTIQDFEQRGELKLTHTTAFTPKDALLTSVNAGVLGIERVGDTSINTVLLGQGLPFATPGKSSVAGAFAGLGMEWRTRSGVSVFGAAEYTAMTDQANLVTARGGIKVGF
jgi:hypothetical protein